MYWFISINSSSYYAIIKIVTVYFFFCFVFSTANSLYFTPSFIIVFSTCNFHLLVEGDNSRFNSIDRQDRGVVDFLDNPSAGLRSFTSDTVLNSTEVWCVKVYGECFAFPSTYIDIFNIPFQKSVIFIHILHVPGIWIYRYHILGPDKKKENS